MEDFNSQQPNVGQAPQPVPVAQPQFYSLDPLPVVPEPWFKNKKILMMMGAGAFAMVFTALLIVFTMNFIDSGKSGVRSRVEEADGITKEKATDCKPDDTVCLDEARADAARAVGEIKACESLSGNPYTKCVTLISRDEKDPELCKVLSGDDRTACEDGSYILKAREDGNGELCEKIKDETTKASCESSFASSTSANVEAAVAGGNPAACETLVGADRENCQDIFSSIDEDKDGLSLGEEYFYKTSDEKADTDGDGYTDGEEIASGHDPLK
jgi:hypothetical protein